MYGTSGYIDQLAKKGRLLELPKEPVQCIMTSNCFSRTSFADIKKAKSSSNEGSSSILKNMYVEKMKMALCQHTVPKSTLPCYSRAVWWKTEGERRIYLEEWYMVSIITLHQRIFDTQAHRIPERSMCPMVRLFTFATYGQIPFTRITWLRLSKLYFSTKNFCHLVMVVTPERTSNILL